MRDIPVLANSGFRGISGVFFDGRIWLLIGCTKINLLPRLGADTQQVEISTIRSTQISRAQCIPLLIDCRVLFGSMWFQLGGIHLGVSVILERPYGTYLSLPTFALEFQCVYFLRTRYPPIRVSTIQLKDGQSRDILLNNYTQLYSKMIPPEPQPSYQITVFFDVAMITSFFVVGDVVRALNINPQFI
ncbi:hypothetical protein C8R44DRAFT_750741 [Mycena epipterygia]|nr:hypothetical protein C8R44DRAFT_750741 [Mycena epipterygia]